MVRCKAKKMYGFLLGIVLTPFMLSAAGGVRGAVYVCGVGNTDSVVNCDIGKLNAVGDERVFNESDLPIFENFTINKTKIITLKVPSGKDTVGWNVLFSSGDFAGKMVQFLCLAEPENDDTVFKIYRKFPEKKVWTEVAEIWHVTGVQELKIVLTPDGAVVLNDPQSGLGVMHVTDVQVVGGPGMVKASAEKPLKKR